MTLRPTVLLAILTTLTAATLPAQADIYYVTYTGTASGTDTNGVFGTAGATINDAAFTATYTYDPTQFGNASQSGNASYIQVFGGSSPFTLNTDPILSETLAINGKTYSAGSSYYGSEYVQGGAYGPYIDTASYLDGSASNYLENYGNLDGQTILSLTAVQAFSFSSSGAQSEFAYNGEKIFLTDTYVSITDGGLSIVPEPASLALLGSAASVFALALGTRRAPSRKPEAMPSSCDAA